MQAWLLGVACLVSRGGLWKKDIRACAGGGFVVFGDSEGLYASATSLTACCDECHIVANLSGVTSHGRMRVKSTYPRAGTITADVSQSAVSAVEKFGEPVGGACNISSHQCCL